MFSPLENEELDRWFQRLNALLKRLPADEQARVQEEVRQHLEALAADSGTRGTAPEAAWRSALEQFGDPESFGRRMAEEWCQSKTGLQADGLAIGFGLALNALFWLLFPLRDLWFQSLRDAHGMSVRPFIAVVHSIIGYGGFALINGAIGRRYPLQAIKGAFYSHLLWHLGAAIVISFQFALMAHIPYSSGPEAALVRRENILALASLFCLPLLWTALAAGVSYLASVTRRGWYWPTWNDFKITLPKRRQQAG